MCAYIYIHMCMCLYTDACALCMCICVCMCTCIFMCIVHVHVCVQMSCDRCRWLPRRTISILKKQSKANLLIFYFFIFFKFKFLNSDPDMLIESVDNTIIENKHKSCLVLQYSVGMVFLIEEAL